MGEEDKFLFFAGTYYLLGRTRPLRYTYVLDQGHADWREVDGEINIPRYGLSQTCYKLGDSVVVVGGKPDVGNNVEIFNAKYEFWQLGSLAQSLPVEIAWYSGSVVDPQGNAYILGGTQEYSDGPSDSILKWDGQSWTHIPNGLPFGMENFPVTLVEDDMFECAS